MINPQDVCQSINASPSEKCRTVFRIIISRSGDSVEPYMHFQRILAETKSFPLWRNSKKTLEYQPNKNNPRHFLQSQCCCGSQSSKQDQVCSRKPRSTSSSGLSSSASHSSARLKRAAPYNNGPNFHKPTRNTPRVREMSQNDDSEQT